MADSVGDMPPATAEKKPGGPCVALSRILDDGQKGAGCLKSAGTAYMCKVIGAKRLALVGGREAPKGVVGGREAPKGVERGREAPS